VPQNRTILFLQYILPHLNNVIGCDPQDKAVEGGVMQFTQCHSVGNNGPSFFGCVGDDVRCIQQFTVSQAAEGALRSIGVEHPLAKATLVHSLTNGHRKINPPGFGSLGDGRHGFCININRCQIIQGDIEGEGCRQRCTPAIRPGIAQARFRVNRSEVDCFQRLFANCDYHDDWDPSLGIGTGDNPTN